MTSPRIGATATSKDQADLCRVHNTVPRTPNKWRSIGVKTANVFANKNILFTVVDYYKHGITKNAANSTLTLYHRVLKKLWIKLLPGLVTSPSNKIIILLGLYIAEPCHSKHNNLLSYSRPGLSKARLS